MKRIGLMLAMAALALSSAAAVAKDTYVKGHVTKKGVYIPGHHRTTPNSSKNDNYSTQGNTNPYTGKKGTRKAK